VTIAVLPWSGYEANAAVVQTILEKQLHYKVVLKKMTAGDAWTAIGGGSLDVMLENWGHAAQEKEYIDDKKTLVKAGLTGNKSYTTNDPALIKNLGLDFTFAYSGGEDATVKAALESTTNKTPLLFYFWEPHWLFEDHRFAKINFPDHSDSCDADAATVRCDYAVNALDKLVSKKFADTSGKAYNLVKNFAWTNADQNEIADYIVNQHLSYQAAAEKWMDIHPDDWEPWLIQQ